MDTLLLVREILGWCCVLNIALLCFAGFALIVADAPIKRLHGRLMGLSEDDLSRAYFQYLANYKIGIFLLNLAPWLALHIAAPGGG